MPDQRARYLRKNFTEAERKLWLALKTLDIPGTHFRRQVPIRGFYPDFVCHKPKIIVEVDGGQHGFDKRLEKDADRSDVLEAEGYKVLRFWNHDVLRNLEGVVETIYHEVVERLRELEMKENFDPLPTRGRGIRRSQMLSRAGIAD